MTKVKRAKKVIGLEEFVPENGITVLLDTNILLNTFLPYNPEKQRKYAALWQRLKKNRANLIVTSIQLSELINRSIRIEYALYKKVHNLPDLDYKKEYRPTDDYLAKMDDILDVVQKDIVPNFQFVNDKFEEMQQSEIFKRGFSYDFNDALLVEIARKYDAVFITEDADFANYKIDFPLVTSNSILLMMKH